jgi:hypothetical protein
LLLLKRFAFLATAALGLGTLAFADTVVVSPGDMGSWSFVATDGTGALCPICAGGGMVTGPASPPLGVGSANLTVPTGESVGAGDSAASSIVSTALDGVSLSSLSALSYSTYDTMNNGSQYPFLQLMISYTDSITHLASSDIIFFEPPYQTPGSGNGSLPDQGSPAPTSTPIWQSWNALKGGWWDNNNFCSPGTGVCSLNTLIVDLPDATITTDSNGNGGAQLTVGYADFTNSYDANVDAVQFGISDVSNTTYDFEPGSATPEPGTFVLFTGAGLLVFAYSRRKAKIVKQAV